MKPKIKKFITILLLKKPRIITRGIIKMRSLFKKVVAKTAKLPLRIRVSALAFVLIVAGAGGYLLIQTDLYELLPEEAALLGTNSVDTSKIIEQDDAISYNRSDEEKSEKLSVVIDTAADSTGDIPYKVDFAKSDGTMTFSDSKDTLTFSITPNNKLNTPRHEDGQIVYPENGNTRHVYIFKRNGVKGDILLRNKPKQNTLNYSWQLNTDDQLEARQQDDGSIGFYSANSYLFGNLEIGDDKSRELVENARKNGEKTNLAFIIPAPYYVDKDGNKTHEGVSYKLDGDTLTLEATNLHAQTYPMSIDPSVVVTTTADFRQGSDDGMIDYGTDGQIDRSEISYGGVSSMRVQSSAFTNGRIGHSSVVYKGYLYIVSGNDGGQEFNDIQYCPLNANGSVGACTQQTGILADARSYHSSIVYNGYLYIIGGYDGSHLNDIQYCPLNANGSVGACTQQTNAFTGTRYEHTSVVHNGYLYIVGGSNDNTFFELNDIQYCPLNANGSVGACTQQTNAFDTDRSGHSSVVYNNNLYIIGGKSKDGLGNDELLNDIQYCPLNANGSVGACTQQTNAFTSARPDHTSVVHNGYLYIVGGDEGQGSALNDIQYCPLNANGSVGACTQQNSAFTTARYEHTSVVHNGFLYIIGGDNNGTFYSDIQYGTLGKLGSVQSTTRQTSAFANTRYDHASVVHNGFLYIVGGNGSGGPYNDIQYCPINANGSVGTCTTNATVFSTARFKHTSVIYNGYLYIIGGATSGPIARNDIQYCPINTNGSVGTCTVQSAAFTGSRFDHTSIVHNGYVYIIGGVDEGDVYKNDIQYASISSNGSLVCPSGTTCNSGTVFTQQTNAFTTARLGHSSVVYNGYLYIVGGQNSTNFNDIQYCPINTNGSVGTCTQQNSAFTTARYEHTSVVHNGYMYIIGGFTGSSTNRFNDIQYCPINTNGSVGTCTQQNSAFTTARYAHTSILSNGQLYIVGGIVDSTFNLPSNDIQYAPIIGGDRATFGSFTQDTDQFAVAREQQGSFIYNGYIYVVGGGYLNASTACKNSGSSTYCNDVQYAQIQSDGSIGSWTTDASSYFATPRRAHRVAVYNGYVYLSGGFGGSGQLADVQYAQINSDGSLGTWSALTNFTGGRMDHGMVAHKGYLYVMGGRAGSDYGDIQYARLASNGAFEANAGCGTMWCTNANTFTTPRNYFGLAVYNDYMYIYGGEDFPYTTTYSDVQYAAINSDGTIGQWNRTTNMGKELYSFHGLAYKGYLFVVAGRDGPGVDQNSIRHAKIQADGSLGQWSVLSGALPATFRGHYPLINNDIVYVVGGFSSSRSQYVNYVEYGKINFSTPQFGGTGSGTLQSNAFTTPRDNHASVIYNDKLYVIGGRNFTPSAVYYNDVQVCSLNVDGTTSSCTTQSNAFTTARGDHEAVVYNGHIYIIGGENLLSDIQYSRITSDGSLACPTGQTCSGGTVFYQKTNALVAGRHDHSAVVHKGIIYVVGGWTGAFSNDIERCPINSDNSVGTCVQQAAAFTGARLEHSVSVYNDFLYIVGGYDGATHQDDIQKCPINGDGTVGSCIRQLNAYTHGRNEHRSTVHNGYLYIIGGSRASPILSDIQHCPILSDGSIGVCVQQNNILLLPITNHTVEIYKGKLLVVGGLDGGSRYAAIWRYPLRTPTLKARYERTIDIGGVAATVDSIQFNGISFQQCGASIHYKTAGSDGVYDALTTVANVQPGQAYAMGASLKRYVHVTITLDDSTCGEDSHVTDITLNYTKTTVPTLVSPTNAQTQVVLNPTLQFRSADSGSDYLRYRVQICSTSDCSSVVETGDQTASQTGWSGQNASTNTAYASSPTVASSTIANYGVQGQLAGGTTYYWRAQAIDPAATNTWTDYSAIQSFTTVTLPQAPLLNAPSNASAEVLLMPQFQFRSQEPNNSYIRYRVQLCNDVACDGVDDITYDQTSNQTGWTGQDAQGSTAYIGSIDINSSTMANYTLQAPLVANTTYYWRASGIDPGDTNVWGDWSVIRNFTTVSPPAAPSLITPVSASIGLSLTPSFTLRSADAGANDIRYRLQLCSNNDCSSVTATYDQTSSQVGWSGQNAQAATAYIGSATESSSAIATYTVQSALNYGTTYYWRASGYDVGATATNSFGAWSTIYSFTTQYVPSVPVLETPAASSSGGLVSPVFRLRSSDGDGDYLRYSMQLCSDVNCNTVLGTYDQTVSQTGWASQDQQLATAYKSSSTVTGSTMANYYSQSALAHNTTYYWRARAIDHGGSNIWSAWSTIQGFTTNQQQTHIRGGVDIRGGTRL